MPQELEETEDTHAQPSIQRPLASLRKYTYILLALFFLWFIFGQAAPLFFFSDPPPSRALNNSTNKTHEPQTSTETQEVPATKSNDTVELQQRIEQLEGKLKAMDEATALAPKASSNIDEEKIHALETRIEALSSKPTVNTEHLTQLEETLKAQAEQLSALKAQMGDMRSQGMNQLSALTSFMPMKEAIVRGEPFATSLEQLVQFTQGNALVAPLLEQLKPYAATGAITLGKLQSQFNDTLAKAATADSNQGTLMRNLASLIRVRKVGEQKGTDDGAILARAETRLEQGNVPGTLTELAALPPATGAVFAPWMSDAQTYIRVHNVLDQLQLALVRQPHEPLTASPAPSE